MAPVRQGGRLRAGLILLGTVLVLAVGVPTAQTPAPPPPNVGPAAVAIAPPLPDAEIERFLLDGKVMHRAVRPEPEEILEGLRSIAGPAA